MNSDLKGDWKVIHRAIAALYALEGPTKAIAGNALESLARLRREADEAAERAIGESIDEATALAMGLANALHLAHAATHPLHLAEPVESCDVCRLIERARRWAR